MSRKIMLFFTVVLILLLPKNVSGQTGIGISGVTFDKSTYTLGSTGKATISVHTSGAVFQLEQIYVYLFFIKTSGEYAFSACGENIVANRGNPLDIPADSTVALTYDFQVPNDSSIVSGYFYYIASIYFRGGFTGEYHTLLLKLGENVANPSQPTYSDIKSNYDSLQSTYNSLQNAYDTLNSAHDSLLSRFGSLQTQQNFVQTLMFVFIVTTLIFVATTVFFGRRPQVKF